MGRPRWNILLQKRTAEKQKLCSKRSREDGSINDLSTQRRKTALEKTNFIKRYEMLSNTFNGERTPLNERLRYIDGEIVLDSLAQLGYKAHFESKEKYFWIEEVQIGTYTFSGNMILDGGLVDIVWIVKENGNLILGLPIGEYSRLMIAPNYKIKKPIFGTYEDLDEIVESVFKLFEDFKKAMTAS